MKSNKTANKQADKYLKRILEKGGEFYVLNAGIGYGIEFKNGSFVNARRTEPLKRTEYGVFVDTKRKTDNYYIEFWGGKINGNEIYLNCTNLKAKKIYDVLKQKNKNNV